MFTVVFGVWSVVVLGGVVMSVRRGATRPCVQRFAASSYWLALVLAVAVGFAPLVAPRVERADGPSEFSVDRALAHIGVVARRPHPIGTAANENVRDYVAQELREMGLDPDFQGTAVPDYYGDARTVEVVNVVARIPGTAPTGAVALVAHFDSFPETPGANDNASGVAVILETARSLLAEGALRNDVILLFTDGEEPAPRYGANAFVDGHRWFDDVRFAINLEAIGSGGPSMAIEINGSQSWVIDRLVAAAPYPVAFSFLTETTELIGGSNTDFAPFRDSGIVGVEFAYARGSPIYHMAADTPESVSVRSLQSHGVNTLGLVRLLGDEDLTSIDGDDRVFFTIGRHHVVRYPARWAMPIVVVAGAVWLATIQRRRSWRATLKSAALAWGAAVSVALVAAVVWTVVAGWRNTMGVAESYVYLFGLVALTAAAMFVPLPGRPAIERHLVLEGIVAVWLVLALVTAFAAPGVSYLFAWPSAAGAAALVVRNGVSSVWLRLVFASLTVLVTCVVMVPAVDTFFQFAQPRPGNPDSQILPAVAIPVLLTALAIQLVLTLRPTTVARPTDLDPPLRSHRSHHRS